MAVAFQRPGSPGRGAPAATRTAPRPRCPLQRSRRSQTPGAEACRRAWCVTRDPPASFPRTPHQCVLEGIGQKENLLFFLCGYPNFDTYQMDHRQLSQPNLYGWDTFGPAGRDSHPKVCSRRDNKEPKRAINSGDIPNSLRCSFWCSHHRSSQNLVETSWNPGGTLVEPYLKAAPDHPGAYLG